MKNLLKSVPENFIIKHLKLPLKNKDEYSQLLLLGIKKDCTKHSIFLNGILKRYFFKSYS